MRTPTKRASSPKKSSFPSAAAMKVKRFGQATYTSMRSMKNGNNDEKLIPITSTFQDLIIKGSTPDGNPTSGSNVGGQPGANPVEQKPKVYKFFKSRQSVTPAGGNMSQVNSATSENKNPTIKNPVPAMANKRPAPKSEQKHHHKVEVSTPIQEAPKQSSPVVPTKTSKVKETKVKEPKSKESKSSTSNHTSPLSSRASVPEETVREKVSTTTVVESLSPTKVTIRKTAEKMPVRKSNVKNVTKPSMPPPKVIISPRVPAGVRASRRLAGRRDNDGQEEATVEEPVQEAISESRPSRHESRSRAKHEESEAPSKPFSRSSRRQKAPETTTIEVLPESDDDHRYMDAMDTMDSFIPEVPESSISNNNTERIVNHSPPINNETNTVSQDTPKVPEVVNALAKPSISSEVPEAVQDPPEVPEIVPEPPKAVPEAPKPPVKKKTFFARRDRKAEFNAKSFFAAEKDEIDLEIEQQQSSNGAGNEKRDAASAIAFDDDNEEVDQLSKLKRVKKAHQCHDLGETAQFDQDIRYYLSGISEKNSNSIRCLSILGLAEKAMKPEFRMQLRAHDDMPRINKALADAASDANLAICASALMFVYNQDRLKMDIDPNALSLMLALLESKTEDDDKVEEKHRTKIVGLVEELKKKGLAQYLKLTEVSAGKLAMETFLGLTSKRAGDWFKEELRKMNGIDFMLNTVMKCADNSHDENAMFKIDRCMHVLENVTFNNLQNQKLVTDYKNKQFIEVCISLMKTCRDQILSGNGNGEKKVFVSTLFSLLRVLTSLTTESAIGCKSIGSFNEILDLLLDLLFSIPAHIPADQRFDLSMIVSCLCINLVEFCVDIRDKIMNSEKNMMALKDYLFLRIAEADKVDKATDEMLESHENVQLTEAMQDNLLKQMISKSGTHMEHSLLAACVCLLFGCCIQENRTYTNRLIDTLPNRSFAPLVDMLKKLRDFAHLADIMTQKGKDRVEKILSVFRLHDMEV